MIKEQYVVMKNGKYLDHLFEDDICLMFRTDDITQCYKWDYKDTALQVAHETGGQVIIVHMKDKRG